MSHFTSYHIQLFSLSGLDCGRPILAFVSNSVESGQVSSLNFGMGRVGLVVFWAAVDPFDCGMFTSVGFVTTLPIAAGGSKEPKFDFDFDSEDPVPESVLSGYEEEKENVDCS